VRAGVFLQTVLCAISSLACAADVFGSVALATDPALADTHSRAKQMCSGGFADACMVRLTVQAEFVAFGVLGMHKLWAVRRRIEAPRADILSVQHDPAAVVRRSDAKVYGTDFIGPFGWYIRAGTYRDGGKLIFWDITNVEHALITTLRAHHFSQLMLELENPQQAHTLRSLL
jgi:hypothetical protein